MRVNLIGHSPLGPRESGAGREHTGRSVPEGNDSERFGATATHFCGACFQLLSGVREQVEHKHRLLRLQSSCAKHLLKCGWRFHSRPL